MRNEKTEQRFYKKLHHAKIEETSCFNNSRKNIFKRYKLKNLEKDLY